MNVILWDVKTYEALTTLTGHQDAVIGVAFNPSGTELATTSLDQTVKVWSVLDTTATPEENS
jgi:WD40 repeat protein